MRSKQTKCIILGHKDVGDNDKIIFLYSEEFGKIKAIAKGAKKITSKFTGHLETLNLCNVMLYFAPKNILITEIETEKSFIKADINLSTIKNALRISEITNQMLYENQILENFMSLIKKTLLHIKKTENPTIICMAYIIKLLDKIGLIPDYKSTKLPIEKKYIKFLNFLKERHFSEIEKIKLTKEERIQSKKIIKNIIQNETNKNLLNF